MPSQSNATTSGLIDTNVYIHAQANDAHAEECLRFSEAVERGDVRARLRRLTLRDPEGRQKRLVSRRAERARSPTPAYARPRIQTLKSMSPGEWPRSVSIAAASPRCWVPWLTTW